MHAEIKLIGQIIAAQSMKPEELAGVGIPVPHGKIAADKLLSLRELYVARQLLSYAKSKATPAIGLEEELRTGHDFLGRPLPWSADKGTEKKPRVSWGEYAWSHAPIPLSGAAKYVYEELRKSGASASDALMWIRAAMVGGASGTMGIEPKEIKEPTPFHQAVRKQRAAETLRNQ
jgi:hypothetical protein